MRAPIYLRLAGITLFVLGAINLVGVLTLNDESVPRAVIIWNVLVSALLVVIGGGLALQQRWAWPFAVLCGASGVGFGLYLVAQPGDITELGTPIVGLLFMLIGVLVLAASFGPTTRRWMHARTKRGRWLHGSHDLPENAQGDVVLKVGENP